MKGVSSKWLVLWSLWLARLVRQPTLPVRVSNGLVRGSIANDGSHRQYLGLPYATIPHRFQAPGPEPIWQDTFEAINENIRCHQLIDKIGVMGQEDCLILNVYTPMNSSPNERLPVMIFIHGGGFILGSSTELWYGPEFLVSKDIILVTINYRLNIQGFLCLGIKEAPGNAGMKDQVAALKWVQRNIDKFGGDPDNVTIFGESAGGASVSYHVLSPMSKGLFQKAIMQSGSSLSAWGLQYSPVYTAGLLAKAMGSNVQEPYDIYNLFVNKTDYELVVTRVPRMEGNIVISELIYGPCVEREIEGVEPFITELPYDIMKKGAFNKVPMIIGLNGEEGYLFAGIENITELPNITLDKSLPRDLAIPSGKEAQHVVQKLNSLYMDDEEISQKTIMKLSRFHGEVYFYYPAFEETELMLQNNDKPVYNYLFNYDGCRNIAKFTLGSPFSSAPGATHSDEITYLFNLRVVVPKNCESKMVNRMTTLWTNFAKFGNPMPYGPSELLPVQWTPTNRENPHMMVLDERFGTLPLWYTDSVKYLREIYSKYRRKQHWDFRD